MKAIITSIQQHYDLMDKSECHEQEVSLNILSCSIFNFSSAMLSIFKFKAFLPNLLVSAAYYTME